MIQEIIGAIFIVGGVFFSLLGVVGILRLPDTYTRLHASGKTGTLGVIALGIGVGLLLPEAALKLLALAVFMVFSGPVVSHSIAAAVHRSTRVKNREAQATGSDDAYDSGIHAMSDIQDMLAQAEKKRRAESVRDSSDQVRMPEKEADHTQPDKTE